MNVKTHFSTVPLEIQCILELFFSSSITWVKILEELKKKMILVFRILCAKSMLAVSEFLVHLSKGRITKLLETCFLSKLHF